MANSRASFEALYRANQQRAAEAEAEAHTPTSPGGSTISLTELAQPLPLGPAAELAAPEAAPPELDGRGASLFERVPRDLGGLADPNQAKSHNPYDSQAVVRPTARSPRRSPGR